MVNPETDLLRRIRVGIPADARLFRNSVGRDRERNIPYGLCPGSADLVGWRTILVRPEHVGRLLAVFAAVEVKTETGRITPDQQHFIDQVRLAGGLAGIARSVEQAAEILLAL